MSQFHYRNAQADPLGWAQFDENLRLIEAMYEVATAAAATAAAVAHFQGAWASLASALAVPASVAHGGGYWLLLEPLADVAAHEPGVSPVWEPINVGDVQGPSGATDGHLALFDGATGKLLKGGGKGLPAGAVVGTTDAQTLSNKTMTDPESTGAIYDNGSVRGNIVAIGALNIDCSLGNYFTKTINGASTFTVSNVPASRAYSFTLELTHTSGAITWFAGVQWPGGTAPSLTTGKTHLFIFVTDDGGTRWRGAVLANYTN